MIRIARWRIIVALACALAVGAIAGTENARSSDRWTHYFDKRTGNVLVVKTACLMAEDSAAHLKLVDYRDGGGHIVYGCERKGY